jgi:hypothetical protein
MAQGLRPFGTARTEIHSTRGARCGGLVHLVRVEPVAVRQHECVRRFRGSEASSIMSNSFGVQWSPAYEAEIEAEWGGYDNETDEDD